MKRSRLAVFISGRGSNLQSLIDLQAQLEIALVVSSKPEVWGLARARRAGLSTIVLDKKIDWQKLLLDLRTRQITDIFLLGFMRLVPESFLQEWGARIYNLHPSLLPAFPGATAIQDSFSAKAPMGVSIHEVIEAVDAGKILLQKSIRSSDQLATAEQRISFCEQELIKNFASKRWMRGSYAV